jgi:phosphate transport system ATP-binding protein
MYSIPDTSVHTSKSPIELDHRVILEAQNISISYHQCPILEDVSLKIYEHQLTCLIGPSGCGKSSFLRCFNRLNSSIPGAKVTGRITLDGQDIHRMQDVLLRRRVGMVFQRPNPFPKSIYENIALGLRINGYRRDLDEQVERSLRQVSLWDEVKDSLHRNALNLSIGQQQRLCIARAIALGSEVLLLDEPCAALDPISSGRINELLNEMKRHYTLVVVTHDLKQAARTANWVAFFDVESKGDRRIGKLIEYNPVPQIFIHPTKQATGEYIYHHMPPWHNGAMA